VERDAAIELLPGPYQQILAWRGEGIGDAEIATRLGVDDDAMGPLIRLAEAKLDRLMANGS
jgi:DNA-directed RNA polymerase specialized sigma24 family protein